MSQDYILGVRGGSIVFSHSRVDADLSGLEEARQRYFMREYHSQGPQFAAGDGYDFTAWHALTEEQAEEDALVADLEAEGLTPSVTSISPTLDEEQDLEDYGVSDRSEVAEALAWGRALRDVEAGNISMADVERGRNPHRGESFDRPRPNRGRGQQ